MKKVTVETVKKELSKVDFYKIIEIATKKFTDACYDEGLSVEKTKKQLLIINFNQLVFTTKFILFLINF